jgi:hypothetical protein
MEKVINCADNSEIMEERRKIKQRWFWVNNIFWWTCGFVAGIVMTIQFLIKP